MDNQNTEMYAILPEGQSTYIEDNIATVALGDIISNTYLYPFNTLKYTRLSPAYANYFSNTLSLGFSGGKKTNR